MQAHKFIALMVAMLSLLLSGCGGGGGGGGGGGSTKITAAINTQITGSNAVSTIRISGATSPIIYGIEMTVNFPTGTVFGSAVVTGVNSGNLIASNPGLGSVFISSGGLTGFGSGEVFQVNFTNVPNSAQAADFTITGFVAKDDNGQIIP